MLHSSKHMTGHQELINSDVSFNNTQLQLQRDKDTWIKSSWHTMYKYMNKKPSVLMDYQNNTHDLGLITFAPCFVYCTPGVS